MAFLKAAVIMVYLPSAYMGILFGRATSVERLLFLATVVLLWVSQENIILNILGYGLAAVSAVSNYKQSIKHLD